MQRRSAAKCPPFTVLEGRKHQGTVFTVLVDVAVPRLSQWRHIDGEVLFASTVIAKLL